MRGEVRACVRAGAHRASMHPRNLVLFLPPRGILASWRRANRPLFSPPSLCPPSLPSPPVCQLRGGLYVPVCAPSPRRGRYKDVFESRVHVRGTIWSARTDPPGEPLSPSATRIPMWCKTTERRTTGVERLASWPRSAIGL